MENFNPPIPDIYLQGVLIKNIKVITCTSDNPVYSFEVNGKKYRMKKDFYGNWEFDDQCEELPLDQLTFFESEMSRMGYLL